MNPNSTKNIHRAKLYNLPGIEKKIRNYNKKYPTPKYLLFMRSAIEIGLQVKILEVKVSKYVFVYSNRHGGKLGVTKVRFSNHKPNYIREKEDDADFYVGVSNFQTSTTEQILEKIKEKYLHKV